MSLLTHDRCLVTQSPPKGPPSQHWSQNLASNTSGGHTQPLNSWELGKLGINFNKVSGHLETGIKFGSNPFPLPWMWRDHRTHRTSGKDSHIFWLKCLWVLWRDGRTSQHREGHQLRFLYKQRRPLVWNEGPLRAQTDNKLPGLGSSPWSFSWNQVINFSRRPLIMRPDKVQSYC